MNRHVQEALWLNLQDNKCKLDYFGREHVTVICEQLRSLPVHKVSKAAGYIWWNGRQSIDWNCQKQQEGNPYPSRHSHSLRPVSIYLVVVKGQDNQ